MPDGLSTSIFSFDPETLETSELEVHLPKAVKRNVAVWTGSEAFIFGGESFDDKPTSDIVRFKPPDTVELLPTSLPHGVKGGSAVWSGNYIYYFGNCICPGNSTKKIIRFNPMTNQSVVLEEELPVPLAGTSAVFYNGSAYIFGGRTGVGVEGQSDGIVKFTPSEGCTVMTARLPSHRFRTSAVLHGSYAYVFGGYGGEEFMDEIVKYDIDRDRAELLSLRLPSPRANRAAVFNGTYSYILGGESETEYLDEILRFDPEAVTDEQLEEPFVAFQLIAIVAVMVVFIWIVDRRRRKK
jgi:N-acetylneuraminic acid mutarotase